MLNSQSAIGAVRRLGSSEQASRVAPRGSRDIHPEQATPTTVISEAKSAMGPAGTIWRSVLWFFLEGFALYGASLHWVATAAVTAIASEVDAQQHQKAARRERQRSISLVSPAARAEVTVLEREDAIDGTGSGTRMTSTRDGLAAASREADRYRFVPPGWLAIIWRAIASWWAKWRREREVRKAAAALAQYDDRILRDMGILGRSRIERIVRDGRDY